MSMWVGTERVFQYCGADSIHTVMQELKFIVLERVCLQKLPHRTCHEYWVTQKALAVWLEDPDGSRMAALPLVLKAR